MTLLSLDWRGGLGERVVIAQNTSPINLAEFV